MPSLSDDGRAVTLDLHGARIDEAEQMILATARLAAKRGRSTLNVVHGASTSSALYRNRTVRHALYDLLDGGRLDAWITDEMRFEGSTVLSLPLTSATDARKLQLVDVRT